jgi:hypothetical protein
MQACAAAYASTYVNYSEPAVSHSPLAIHPRGGLHRKHRFHQFFNFCVTCCLPAVPYSDL